MTDHEIEHAIQDLEAWSSEATDLLRIITDRLEHLHRRIEDLHARVSEFRQVDL